MATEPVLTATLGSLDALTDRLVRVGGRLEAIEGRRLTLDDGTARGHVRLPADIGSLHPAPPPGGMVNATGRVERGRDGPEVVVGSLADLRWAAATVLHQADEAASVGSAAAPLSPATTTTGSVAIPLTTPAAVPWLDGLPLVAAGLAAASMVSLASAVLFARRSRRSLAPLMPG